SVLAQGTVPDVSTHAAEHPSINDNQAQAATDETAAPDNSSSAPPDTMLSLLPEDLSLRGMFLHADIVVKAVILGLAFASMVTWAVWLAKSIELMVAKRRLRRAYRILRDARNLTLALETLSTSSSVARALLREAIDEWRRSVEALEDRRG